jgi:hypothetical protein
LEFAATTWGFWDSEFDILAGFLRNLLQRVDFAVVLLPGVGESARGNRESIGRENASETETAFFSRFQEPWTQELRNKQ